MKFNKLEIDGVYEVENYTANDERGIFVKTFNSESFDAIGHTSSFKESYYSQSVKNVIRGLHFQTPPFDHEKLVYVTAGEILDVILDLRITSPTYGKSISIKLQEYGKSVFIPKGCAHGFLALSDYATVIYNVTTVYNKAADSGILWNSFGFNWGIDNPIMSSRDIAFETFVDFKSQF